MSNVIPFGPKPVPGVEIENYFITHVNPAFEHRRDEAINDLREFLTHEHGDADVTLMLFDLFSKQARQLKSILDLCADWGFSKAQTTAWKRKDGEYLIQCCPDDEADAAVIVVYYVTVIPEMMSAEGRMGIRNKGRTDSRINVRSVNTTTFTKENVETITETIQRAYESSPIQFINERGTTGFTLSSLHVPTPGTMLTESATVTANLAEVVFDLVPRDVWEKQFKAH